MNVKIKTVAYHLVGWLFYSTYSTVATFVRDSPPNFVFWRVALSILINVYLFYAIVYWVNPYIFEKRNYRKVIGTYILICISYYWIHYLRIWVRTLNETLPEHFTSHAFLVPQFIVFIVEFTAFALVYGFYHFSLRQQKEKLVLEQEKYQIEIGFLRGQIHDHFVYNMLNLFHDKAEVYSEELAEGILTLSDLMRYSVTECTDGLVALEKEVECVRSLIALNQQRFGETIQVKFSIEGQIDDWQVPHLSILTLVENVFKHGSLKASPLEFDLKVSAQRLDFTTKNASKPTQASASTGIGTKNLERRLNLIIPARARLTSLEDNHFFYTHLTITR